MVPFEDAYENPQYEVIVMVCGSQMGKTDAILDIIGFRVDTRPRPQLYVGPSKDFVEDQFSPRIGELVKQSKTLQRKASTRRTKKTLKYVAGIKIRLAWAGSATQLSSDSFGDVHVDELDRMTGNVKNEGDPLKLAKARSFTYRDRKIVVTSTPLVGIVDSKLDEEANLEFWKVGDPDDIQSPIWQLFQSGTMHHWAWGCPHCAAYFIPRFKLLRWPGHGNKKKADPAAAYDEAYLECPNCGGVIEETHKKEMNRTGVFVAPGQSVTDAGIVVGDPPKSRSMTFWVSGLASPFITFGERAAEYLEAVNSGKQSEIQTVINTGFGELFAPGGGDVPEWTEVARRRSTLYSKGEVPEDVQLLTMAVDIQKTSMWWTIRGWGHRATSWLIDAGQIRGETIYDEIWHTLEDIMFDTYDGMPIRLCVIDTGFRPGKIEKIPENKVYEFCRRWPQRTLPTKGSSTPMRRPISSNRIDVNIKGKVIKNGLELFRLDTDYHKSWVHERVRWDPDQPGAWNLPSDIDDDYCMQIVSEARIKKPSGRVQWVQRSKDNHYLDCEAMQVAAGSMLNVIRLPNPDARRPAPAVRKRMGPEEGSDVPATPKKRKKRKQSFLNSEGSIW
jgi:phage terminase large subunit GpA-like protein